MQVSRGQDRVKGGLLKREALGRQDGLYGRLDQAALLAGNDRLLRRHNSLDLLGCLLRPEPEGEANPRARVMLEGWRRWLLEHVGACLSPGREELLGKRYFVMRRRAEGATPTAQPSKRRPLRTKRKFPPRAPLADFLRDPSLLPKAPPGRRGPG